jgi:hypothetical protein
MDRNLKVPKAAGPHQGEEIAEANQAEVEAVKIAWWPRLSSATAESLTTSMASSGSSLAITKRGDYEYM